MRVAPFELDGQRHAVVAHADITDRRLAEEAADERADQLAHLLDRINGLVRTVTGAVVEARTRTAIERSLCEAFVGTTPYISASILRPDLRAETLVPKANAGLGPDSREELSISSDTPAALAYRTDELQVQVGSHAPEDAGREGSDIDPLGETERNDGAKSAGLDEVVPRGTGRSELNQDRGPDGAVAAAAVPLTYRETKYGVLALYADRSDAFDDRELAVLSALAEIASTAIHAVTAGRILKAESVVEIDVRVADDGLAVVDAAGSDAKLTYEDFLVTETGDLRLYLTVTSEAPEAVRDRVTGRPDVTSVQLLTEFEGGALLALVVTESLLESVLDFGGNPAEVSVTDGAITATLQFPDEAAARAAFDHLQDRYTGVELVGYRDRERAPDTATGFRADLRASLSDRQLEALRLAYHSGYFDRPRGITGEEIADAMDITRATFHQHLRVAYRKVAGALLEPVR